MLRNLHFFINQSHCISHNPPKKEGNIADVKHPAIQRIQALHNGNTDGKFITLSHNQSSPKSSKTTTPVADIERNVDSPIETFSPISKP